MDRPQQYPSGSPLRERPANAQDYRSLSGNHSLLTALAVMVEEDRTEPKLVSLYGMYIVGAEVRTTNRDERDGGTAKIPSLWERVNANKLIDIIPDQLHPTVTIAAYTRYQSDDTGPYSLIVGAEVDGLSRVPPGMVGITVLAQEYLIFDAAGRMPAAVLTAWSKVWRYFSQPTVLHRSFTTDFERYDSAKPDTVELHIAVR